MPKLYLPLLCWVLFSQAATLVRAQVGEAADRGDPLIREQKHFLECLGYVYSPALWISYGNSLYFVTFTEAQAQQLADMKAARSKYVAFSDRQQRYALAANAIQASGIDKAWQQKVLLPYSDTNQNLTPTLNRVVRMLPAYQLLQKLGNGDALIQDDAGTVFFVMNHGRATDDAACTNGLFVREGEKTYTTQSGRQNTVLALNSVGLSAAEKLVLQRVSTQFRKQAATLKEPPVITAQDRDEFELLKSRATDSSPFMQFLVARAYLEGKGTRRDEKLGLEWMRRAESNGSGDARSYMQVHQKPK